MDQYPLLDKNQYTRRDRLKDTGYLTLFFIAGFICGVGIVGGFCYLVYSFQHH